MMFRQAQHTNKKSTLNLPKGWEIKTLGEVCDILDNKRKPITKKDRVEGEIPYYGATGVLSYVIDFLFDEKLVLLGEDGAKWESGDNSAFIISGKTWVNNHAHVLRPNREILIDNWLVYNLNFQNLMPFVTGMTVPKLSQGNMKKIQIPIPPLSEQKQIVAILDKAFTAIDQAKANISTNIANAKEFQISATNNLFNSINDSELLTVDDITDFITDYVSNGSFASLKENVNYKSEKDYAVLLRLTDHSKKFKNNFVYVDKHSFDFLKKSTVYPNDIILSNVGARLGTAFRAPDLGMPMTLGPNAMLIKAEKYGDYFFCWLQSAYGQKAIKSVVSGAGQPKFNKTLFKKIKVPIPKEESARNQLVNKINLAESEFKNLFKNYTKKLDSLEELKKSILKKAFVGELTQKEVLV